MIEVRWHGRGGQGAVTSVELLALAAIEEGKYAQGFPAFGPERRGAPVMAYNRISEKPIKIRSGIYHPDVVVVLDPSLIGLVNVTDGLKPGGLLVINTAKPAKDLRKVEVQGNLATVDATHIAREELGVPIANTTMIGAVLKATKVLKFESLDAPIEERFGRIAGNKKALKRAYEQRQNCEVKNNRGVLMKQKKWPEAWHEVTPGCMVLNPGSASTYKTGSWRAQRPIWENASASSAGSVICFAPKAAYLRTKKVSIPADMDYCKGCGICAHECWPGAIEMKEEES